MMEVSMKIASKLLLGLALLQGAAYAADEPKIEVIDGKISISAQAVPFGRFLAMFEMLSNHVYPSPAQTARGPTLPCIALRSEASFPLSTVP